MAMVYRCVGILTLDVIFFRSPGIFHSQDSFHSTFRPRLWETSSGVAAVGVFQRFAAPSEHLLFKTLAKLLDDNGARCYDHEGIHHGYDKWFLAFRVVFSNLLPFVTVFIILLLKFNNINIRNISLLL